LRDSSLDVPQRPSVICRTVLVLVGSSVTGSLLDLDLPSAVPWLILAAVPALAVALLPSRSERQADAGGAH
jgi:hypothetical protein